MTVNVSCCYSVILELKLSEQSNKTAQYCKLNLRSHGAGNSNYI